MPFTLPFPVLSVQLPVLRQPGDGCSTVQPERRSYPSAKLKTFMKVSISTCRKVGNIHTSSTQQTSTFLEKKKISYHGCTCGRRNPFLLNVRKRLAGEMFCCDCTRKQTGHVFIARCYLSEKLLLGHPSREAAGVRAGLLCMALPGAAEEAEGPLCLQQGTLWVQTLLVTQMEELLYNVL